MIRYKMAYVEGASIRDKRHVRRKSGKFTPEWHEQVISQDRRRKAKTGAKIGKVIEEISNL